MAIEPLRLDTDALGEAQFHGLRMDVDEFLALPDDGHKYEMLNGVVIVSPRPTPMHQGSGGEIYTQLRNYLSQHPVGRAFYEVDVHLGESAPGDGIVYAPDIVFIRRDRVADMRDRITGAPDLVVEVVSRGSRGMDTITKREDYERFGVGEYWIVDPQRQSITFLRLEQGKFVEIQATGDQYKCKSVEGFVLDVAAVRKTFKPW